MYGPQRERPCPMCTAFLGSLDIPVRDLTQRVAFAVIGRSPVERQLAFARERGWRNLKFYATVGDDYARDYRGLAPDGSEMARAGRLGQARRRRAALLGRELGGTSDPARTRAAHPTRPRCGTSSTSRRAGGGRIGIPSSSIRTAAEPPPTGPRPARSGIAARPRAQDANLKSRCGRPAVERCG
jgi:hypothetical protein